MTWAALILWPIISVIFFTQLRMPVALVATLIGGFLLLPTNTAFDVPILPALDKHTIPALTAVVLTMIMVQRGGSKSSTYHSDDLVLPGWLPRDPVVITLMTALIAGTVITVMTNKDALFYGPRVLQGLRPYDAMSAVLDVLMLLLPFLLGRKLLASSDSQRVLLSGIAIAATAYAFLALFEVRMSPQINNMVYGFFPHSWMQHYRDGGWRPLVFLSHGLVLGIFFSMAILSAVGLALSSQGKPRTIWVLIAIWLFFTMFMSKVLGAFLITVFSLGVLLFLPRRLQVLTATCVVICVLTYPILRAADLVPVENILGYVSPDRAWSLKWRLDNEKILLEKANERLAFGWGGWGRSRVFSEEGRDIATTDGAWVITLGLGGWVRYVGIFGLLSWGILALVRQRNARLEPVTVALALALMANLIDLIPNSGLTPVTWMIAGALCGRLEKAAKLRPEAKPALDDSPERRAAYSRGGVATAYGVAPESRHSLRTPAPAAERPSNPYRRDFGEKQR